MAHSAYNDGFDYLLKQLVSDNKATLVLAHMDGNTITDKRSRISYMPTIGGMQFAMHEVGMAGMTGGGKYTTDITEMHIWAINAQQQGEAFSAKMAKLVKREREFLWYFETAAELAEDNSRRDEFLMRRAMIESEL